MNKSESITEIAKALARAQGEMQSAKKTADNPFFKSKYADLHEVMDSIREPLSKNGLSISQLIQPDPNSAVVETLLLHESGEWLSSIIQLQPVKNDPQGMGSAITYARRYAVSSIVGLASEKDDDGNEASKTGDKQKAVYRPSSKPTGEGIGDMPKNTQAYQAELRWIKARLGYDFDGQSSLKYPEWNKGGDKAPSLEDLRKWKDELEQM